MSQENVDVVNGLFENTNARDFGAVLEAYADDIVLVLHGETQIGGKGEIGKEAVGRWFGEWFSTFDRDYRFEIEEVRDWGDRVFVVATHHGRGRASGVPFADQAAWIYTVLGGKIVRCDAYDSRAQALEAAGQRE